MPYQTLTDEQVEGFLNKGYVKLEGCFQKERVQDWIDLAFKRLGYDPKKPATWQEDRIHMPSINEVLVPEFAPRAWAGMCDLMGGESRIKAPVRWRDGFIINFKLGYDDPWQPPSRDRGGWHKDGDWFRHFLDSPEQGLLTVVLWDDVRPKSGGTFIATDSVQHIARYLLEFPEGLTPKEAAFRDLIHKCETFEEVTGKAGDVFLLHPYILHSASSNTSGYPRIITNPAVSFNEPMNFNRDNSDDYCLVERAVLHALNADHLDFKITHPRERITPERVHRQKKMMAEQKARLGTA